MEIRKAAEVSQAGMPNEKQLEAIHKLTKSQVEARELYVFALRLCDDQLDRDFERFDTAALPKLAELFVGKTGIADHKWSTEGQVARIFATEVVCENGVSYIKAWAYMRRGEETESLIQDIEAGIKKEVSVGCAMGGATCSVCGGEYGSCVHQKGNVYDGKLCCAVLINPVDAYEFSFVAVPAQKQAGVMKAMRRNDLTLKELVEQTAGEGAGAEYRKLCALAEAGKHHQQQLRKKVRKFMGILDLGLDEGTLEAVAERMDGENLERTCLALEEKVAQLFPPAPQLPGDDRSGQEMESAFLI